MPELPAQPARPTPIVLTEERVRALLPLPAAIEVTRDALVAHAAGRVTQPDPWHLEIPEARGEVHIKGAYVHGSGYYAAKLATGFYGNGARGLPVSSGLSVVADAVTGFPVVIALDGGYLTDARTAAAGALATAALARPDAEVVALAGPGIIGELTAEALLSLRNPAELRIYGPTPERARAAAGRLSAIGGWTVTAVPGARQAIEGADIVITATPTRAPHIDGAWLAPGAHVTALGADMTGKRELMPSVLERAGVIAADDVAQSRAVGELQYAPGLPAVALGDVLAARVPGRTDPSQITVADLTGLGAEDAAVGAHIAAQTAAEA
ncbi:ornithine cyclodeaminase family protein [Actinomadura rupiterrae]|uniref:ornithine cyclodeaminase family protein n=1 Tax=Actinomadura rupiterrae TaxID=559627 RepID=UPI0020A345D9|nr:ornithine cyclodeaminase family protein [Actinomadura rupiterrae]MCP2336394.1 ornithine cyclodeaminase [Actinomadura rupiterrae]